MKYQVYVHTFPNNKKYVGLSTMENINQRWENGYGYKTQKLMYRAILKYGWKNIKHTVYQCDTEKEMKYLERYLISYYQTRDRRYGYNLAEGGQSGPKGIPAVNRRAVDQYDRQGNFIRTWESMGAIEEELNYHHSHISACVNKKRLTAYNFYWFYANETPVFKTFRTRRKVRQYDLNGNFIAEYKNCAEAARSLGKNNNVLIAACCNKKFKTAYNYIWKYEC